MAPANIPQAFVTLGSQPARILTVFDAAGDMEGFFAEYAPLVDVSGEPDQKEIRAAYEKH